MGRAAVTEIFDCTPEELFNILTDYEKYPDFLDEVKDCRVVSKVGERPIVEFEISVVKTFRYRLRMDETRPTKVAWAFTEGDVFKSNVGSWDLKDLGNGKTEVAYNIEVKFSMFVPSMIEKKIIEINIPSMMSSYKKRVKELRK